MPPTRRITKEDIIKVTIQILKDEPLENINARRLATALNCSVQPIFYNFKNMEEVKKVAIEEIHNIYQSYMIEGSNKAQSYKGMGLAYIKFAKDYPNYFKILFMSQTNLTPVGLIEGDNTGNEVILKGMELTGYTYQEQRDFHVKVWIFTHGIATLVATKTVNLSESEIDKLLEETVREMIIGRKSEENANK